MGGSKMMELCLPKLTHLRSFMRESLYYSVSEIYWYFIFLLVVTLLILEASMIRDW